MWLALVALLATMFAERDATSQGAIVRYVSNSPNVDVVIAAHQDDWQLFMGDVVARQMRTGNRVVFIYLTAGDDGRDSLYWMTRERGALESTRAGIGAPIPDSGAARCSTTKALEHLIRSCTIANTESYFLRLPDGERNGIGFARHAGASLRKLRGKRISSIPAIDGSTAYEGWTDLVATVVALVGDGSAARIVTIHTSDPNIVVNPHDHFDHRMAGLLVADARRKSRWNVVYYTGYALATRAANRSKNQSRQKVALFQAYDAAMTRINPAWSAYREHPAFYSQCMLRTYARKVPWR
jgi:LmbE family N-acetylglucosaminyl deacetylase